MADERIAHARIAHHPRKENEGHCETEQAKRVGTQNPRQNWNDEELQTQARDVHRTKRDGSKKSALVTHLSVCPPSWRVPDRRLCKPGLRSRPSVNATKE